MSSSSDVNPPSSPVSTPVTSPRLKPSLSARILLHTVLATDESSRLERPVAKPVANAAAAVVTKSGEYGVAAMCSGTIISRPDDLAGPVFTLYGVPPAGGHGEGCPGCLSIGMTIPPHWGLPPGLWGGISAVRGRRFGVISSA